MKLNKNSLEGKTLRKTFINFILLLIICSLIAPVMSSAIYSIIMNMDFQWLYDLSPSIYSTATYWFYFFFLYGRFTNFMLIFYIAGISIFLYKSLKKDFYYISELGKASNQLLDKNIEYIQLPPELKEIETRLNHLKLECEKNERLAKESEQRKNDLIVYLAHDLKTPLTSVIGYLELLKDTPDLSIELRMKYTNITLDKAYHLEDLMNEFFEIAKFNDSNIVLMKKNLNLKFMLEQLVDEFFPLANEQNKEIVIDCDEGINCYADPDKLSRVFNNVIQNAISYSFENTKIIINAFCENGLITVSIQNEGYTIPENKLASIFEKFYRLDDSRSTSNGGAGLGLAIAKEILNLHGGTIQAKSKDNKTTFILTIPQNKD